MDNSLLLVFLAGISILLILILVFKVHAFISLLIASISIGLLAGMPFSLIIENIGTGMGNTLSFVAVVVGLGAIFGAILEHSGATSKLSDFMLSKFGLKRSAWALGFSGFLIAIPVFFDVAFIILVPVIYALQKKTGKSLLYFAIPLLAGLAVTHAFIPPTPGPIAVADIIGADLGWVIIFGFITAIPTTVIAGIFFGKFISNKIYVAVPKEMQVQTEHQAKAYNLQLFPVFLIILLPLLLIILNTVLNSIFNNTEAKPLWVDALTFIGHPFSALSISTLLAMYLLGLRYGVSRQELQSLSTKALGPAGIIILITGAGGVFKQMLIETGAGIMLAEKIASYTLAPTLIAFIIALLIRLLQGSATVAMITAAGMMAPLISTLELNSQELALIVLSIAAGSSGFSHVNDSGFWLVNRYLGLTEAQTLKSWTMMTGLLAIAAILIISLMSLLINI